MKSLQVMPNFTILAEVQSDDYIKKVVGTMYSFCVVESNVEHVDNFKVTPKSFWEGMNTLPETDFITFLEEHSKEELPQNVKFDLTDLQKRFGKVTLVGDDCLSITEPEILIEISNNTRLQECVYEIEGSLVFFANISYEELRTIFEEDIGYPIKIRQSKMRTYVLVDSDNKSVAVKASSPKEAFKSLYGKHSALNESDLRVKLNYKKEFVDSEQIDAYTELLYNDRDLCEVRIIVKTVPHQATLKPISF